MIKIRTIWPEPSCAIGDLEELQQRRHPIVNLLQAICIENMCNFCENSLLVSKFLLKWRFYEVNSTLSPSLDEVDRQEQIEAGTGAN